MDYLIRIIFKSGLILHTKMTKKHKVILKHILGLMTYKCKVYKKSSTNGQILLMKSLIIGFVKEKHVQVITLHFFN